MCGIAGVTGREPKEALVAAVRSMTGAMVHRGPDDDGLDAFSTTSGVVVLGARRLAIQDLSPAGHQPMRDPQSGSAIVFNGEIYNFRDLGRELEQRGETFRSGSDTEVLLACYRLWGTDMLPRLRGMFALAIWDARARKLVLARDRVGVKPLYVAETGGQIVFASELRSLFASGMIRNCISTKGLDSYLQLGAVQEPLTIFEGVRMFPPGHYGFWRGSTLQMSPYWSVEDCFRHSGETRVAWQDAVTGVRGCLAEAVKLRLISDAPVGVFLSGGLDSSAITALAAQQSVKPVRTFSLVFRELEFDESPYINMMVQRYATRHTAITVAPHDFLEQLPAALAAMDQPTFDGVNTYLVSKHARANGLTVALSGIGGDELFGGYPGFERMRRMRTLATLLPGHSGRLASAGLGITFKDTDPTRKLRRWLSTAPNRRVDPAALTRELFSPFDRGVLLGNSQMPADTAGPVPNGLDDFNTMSAYEISHYMRNVLLRDMDVMSMASSLELREPFLDHTLIEEVAALPGSLKRSRSHPKALLREAMRHDLPSQILDRRKTGFTLPFAKWMHGPLRGPVGSVLADAGVGGQLRSALDPIAVEQVWARFLNGGGSWVRPWSLFALKTWAERWLQ